MNNLNVFNIRFILSHILSEVCRFKSILQIMSSLKKYKLSKILHIPKKKMYQCNGILASQHSRQHVVSFICFLVSTSSTRLYLSQQMSFEEMPFYGKQLNFFRKYCYELFQQYTQKLRTLIAHRINFVGITRIYPITTQEHFVLQRMSNLLVKVKIQAESRSNILASVLFGDFGQRNFWYKETRSVVVTQNPFHSTSVYSI